MSDIFISYKREEQEKAKQFADALEREGWSVWWDPKLRAGEHFDEVIEAALEESICAVVLWSPLSVKSRWIRDEATYALDRDKLVPVMIEDAELPLRFVTVETRRMVGWDGSEDSFEFRRLVKDIEGIAELSSDSVVKAKRKSREVRSWHAAESMGRGETRKQDEAELMRKEEEGQRKAKRECIPQEAKQKAEEEKRRKVVDERKRIEESNRTANEEQRRKAEQKAKSKPNTEEQIALSAEQQPVHKEVSKTPEESYLFGGLVGLLAAAIPVFIWYISEGYDSYFVAAVPVLLIGCTVGGFIFRASSIRTATLVCAVVGAVAMGVTYGVTGRIATDPAHLLWIPIGAVIWGLSAAVVASFVEVIREDHSG